ncbi:hypothetical protein [Bacillus infantis]|uniref:hypothetical protein n=1 Tax=Bacillus infantis TaxID=324767 RepID=UPI00321901FB
MANKRKVKKRLKKSLKLRIKAQKKFNLEKQKRKEAEMFRNYFVMKGVLNPEKPPMPDELM